MCRIYFYSRPCGRGDGQQILKVYEAKAISTHAPAGGATDCRAVFREPCFISTHAPAGGATGMQTSKNATGKNFYSRPCGRGDSIFLSLVGGALPHFYSRPCGRGDRSSANTSACRSNFYSRPCGRGDSTGFVILLTSHPFLLTPLREGRQARQAGALCGADFYSRPCGRGDKHIRLIRPHPVISTHAPAGGATPAMMHSAKPTPISTHAPAGGATADLRRCWKHRPHFYSRPCGRGDQMSGLRFESMAISTHAPAGGATRRRDNRKGAYTIFLLTPLREGRPARKTESRNL